MERRDALLDIVRAVQLKGGRDVVVETGDRDTDQRQALSRLRTP